MDHDAHTDIVFQHDHGAAAVWEDFQGLGEGSATFSTVLAIPTRTGTSGGASF